MSLNANQVRVVIADNHAIVRQGLASMVRTQTPYQIVGEASDGEEAWQLVSELRPELAVVDLAMPCRRGLELSSLAREREIPTSFVLLTMHKHSSLVAEAKRDGAAAVVVKDDAFEDLVAGMASALAGHFFISRSLLRPAAPGDRAAPLSPRERQIIRGIIEGKTNKDLAAELEISVKTIQTHRLRLMKKLNAHNTADIVRKGMEMGL